MWRAVLTRPIYFRGETHREGATIDLTDAQMRDLSQAGVIGAPRRIHDKAEPPATPERSAPVELMTMEPPEDASKNYRRRVR